MAEPLADVATAVALGRRDRQEDAVVADFADGAETGLAVLSDGMGGHDDGDLASRIIVSEVFGALCVSGRPDAALRGDVSARLHDAVQAANRSLHHQVASGTGQPGMGGTLITTVIEKSSLRWISIGDSGLYLFRDGTLTRLNEIHSLAPQIDKLVQQGAIDAETARTHPQRACLTSALVGSAIARIDCPADPVPLCGGDIVLMASDGLDVLEDRDIAAILDRGQARPSQHIARALIDAVAARDAPDQDNVSIVVIKPALDAPAPITDMSHHARHAPRTSLAGRIGERVLHARDAILASFAKKSVR
ncbi:protein phosphatase 2C domain-containing protein [Cognatishimia sp. F0-27]|uniref:PP2C family protein-serine/threonine phosphatase n=1 Tax=Cognatishimia sp. F0-27 TaxID=2816855 RepID=UPI001D0C1D59